MSSSKVRFSSMLFFAFLLFTKGSILKAQQVAGTSSRTANELPHISLQLMLPGQEESGRAADGVVAYFSTEFSNAVGYEDSYKFTNPDENMGILRNGKLLCIEGRKPVTTSDTLPLKIWKLYQKKYTLKAEATNFSGVSIYIHDEYLGSNTKVDDSAPTLLSFSIDADPASIATDRFTVFMKTYNTYSTLPVQLTSIKANEKNKGVEILWNAENESNIDHYEIEQSSNGRQFSTVGTARANNNSGLSASYSWFDNHPVAGDEFYRVKSLDKSGEIKYTPIVKVQVRNVPGNISATTAAQGNAINLFFKNGAKGNYKLSLVNYSGQTIYSGSVSYDGGNVSNLINIDRYVPSGIYQLLVFHDNLKEHLPVLFQ